MLTHDNKKGPWCAYAFIITHFQTTVHVLRCVQPRIVNMVKLFSLQLISDKTINPNRLGPLAFCLCSFIFTQINPVMHCVIHSIYIYILIMMFMTIILMIIIILSIEKTWNKDSEIPVLFWHVEAQLYAVAYVSKYFIRYTDTIYVFKSYYPCLLACIFYID